MGKYLTIFKISWETRLAYRFDFLVGRFRNIVVLLILYYIWNTLSQNIDKFAGYERGELFTYVFGAIILKSIILGSQSRQMAIEINNGTFSRFLVQPINYFWVVFWRELAEKCLNLVSAVFEIIVFVLIVGAPFFWQSDLLILALFLASAVFAFILYFILSYLVNLIAFWSREAMGPRFLFEWFLEFSSGIFFPLSILPKLFFISLSILPFAYLIYFPLRIYLGKADVYEIVSGFLLSIFWIIAIGLLTRLAWLKGLKKYSGEGM